MDKIAGILFRRPAMCRKKGARYAKPNSSMPRRLTVTANLAEAIVQIGRSILYFLYLLDLILYLLNR